jgi:ribonuclease Y
MLVTAMERMASEVTAERTLTSVKLEDEEMKGRIIGKEGRNIQALQKATGVDIMVDDTPGYIVLSCFDPVRREVARQALEMLLKDGRVHPGRIEEVVEKAQKKSKKTLFVPAKTPPVKLVL